MVAHLVGAYTVNAREALAERLGINGSYQDIWGTWHPISEATRAVLLAALDGESAIDHRSEAEMEDAAARSLAELERDAWSQTLPPVWVATSDDGALDIEFIAPASGGEAMIRWRVLLEQNGQLLQGESELAASTVLEQRELDGTALWRLQLRLAAVPQGYHRFELLTASQSVAASMALIVCPGTCFRPDDIARGLRIWGPAVQLYAVRSSRNWGVGDFGDLKNLITTVAAAGAGMVGLNPLHALFPQAPEAASPYGPSDRRRLNIMMLDVTALPEYEGCRAVREKVESADFQAQLVELRSAPLVNYFGVAALKLPALRELYGYFVQHEKTQTTPYSQSFLTWCEQEGESFRLLALYDAIQNVLTANDSSIWGWPVWPEALRDHASSAVAEFAAEHSDEIDFHLWLQWHAERQFAAAADHALACGMPLGLYRDLAVGVAAGGAATWATPKAYALGVRVGAPPDEYNPQGQEWGLPPLKPNVLRETGYAHFVNVVRANMQHAGALRIDHVMSLARLFWIPADRMAKDGTYVAYPLRDMAAIVALESQRARCVVVGEDLGTVPPEMRLVMQARGMLSYRPLYFERGEADEFRAPWAVPRDALVTLGTHDLPTWSGFWSQTDLDTRDGLGLFPTPEIAARSRSDRLRDRAGILRALDALDLNPQLKVEAAQTVEVSAPAAGHEQAPAMENVYAYIARSPAALLAFQLEDVFEEAMQINLPGTTDDRHPNWRRKLVLPLEEWASDPRMQRLTQALRRERGAAPGTAADRAAPTAVIPVATYRLQFHAGFGFDDATAILPYLKALGISHVYASPIMKARPGSTHGYDVIDHSQLNPELGSPESFTRYCAALKKNGLGQLLDIVPNHMGVLGADNPWWQDVLTHGPASRYARHFDINWSPMNPLLAGKVLMPVLGEQYGAVLAKGELKLEFDAAQARLEVAYYTHRLPLDPREWPRVLTPALEFASEEDRAALAECIAVFEALPLRETEHARTRATRAEAARIALAALLKNRSLIAESIAASVAAINAEPSHERTHQLLEAQVYRLAHWRVASDDINYRRFFDINDLAGLRMQSPEVFEDVHRLVFQWINGGCVDGLRIDHPDGLHDPAAYFEALQARAGAATAGARPLYVVVEKIVAEHERLPESWPVHGETGYRFVNLVNGIFVDGSAEERFSRLYAGFSGKHENYEDILFSAKKLILSQSLSSEFAVLANLLHAIARSDPYTRDFTLNNLRSALAEVIAAFPVYRSYIVQGRASETDRRYVDWAISVARKRARQIDPSVFDFFSDILLDAYAREKNIERRVAINAFVSRFQQVTAPVTAKAMEDTSFYRYNRLASLNEVGGDPRSFGLSVAAFHKAMEDRVSAWPHALSGTSTHDTKRGEDVRARINVLSENPPRWRLELSRFARLNARHKTKLDNGAAPSANDEYLLYQTLLGAWPGADTPLNTAELASFRERIQAYMLKAVREAKANTSWVSPNAEYEAALAKFIDAILSDAPRNRFLAALRDQASVVARFGRINGLAQLLIKCMAPGVPDIYQGSELWDLSLVDPDNRRSIDYAARSAILNELSSGNPSLKELLQNQDVGRIKFFIGLRALQVRADNPMLFASGNYSGLQARGVLNEHVCAFSRAGESGAVVVVTTRLSMKLAANLEQPWMAPNWKNTEVELPLLKEGWHWRDAFTGDAFVSSSSLSLAALLHVMPLSLLVAEPI